METIKVGDLVETCSLMPGVVMLVNGDKIEVRSLEIPNENYKDHFSSHDIGRCGIRKLTPEQVLIRLQFGKEELTRLYREANGDEKEYNRLLINKSYMDIQ